MPLHHSMHSNSISPLDLNSSSLMFIFTTEYTLSSKRIWKFLEFPKFISSRSICVYYFPNTSNFHHHLKTNDANIPASALFGDFDLIAINTDQIPIKTNSMQNFVISRLYAFSLGYFNIQQFCESSLEFCKSLDNDEHIANMEGTHKCLSHLMHSAWILHAYTPHARFNFLTQWFEYKWERVYVIFKLKKPQPKRIF